MLVHGEGSDPTTYFGVHTSRDGRWLVVSGSAGTAPRDDVWIADLAGDGSLRDFQVGVDAQTAAWVARDGRLWLMSDRDTPRWRLAVADPADPATWAPEAWQDVIAQQPDAVLSDVALVDAADGTLQVLAVHAVDATDRLSVWAADGSGRVAGVGGGLGAGSISGVSSRPEGGTEAWVGYTDYATPPSVLHWDAGSPTLLTSWEVAAVAGDVPALTVVETHATAPDGTPIHVFVLSGSGPPGHPPAGGALRLRRLQRLAHPGLHRAGAGLGGRGRRVGGRQPARRLRARRGVAPGRACGSASRTCSTTSRPPGNTWSPRAGRRTIGSR